MQVCTMRILRVARFERFFSRKTICDHIRRAHKQKIMHIAERFLRKIIANVSLRINLIFKNIFLKLKHKAQQNESLSLSARSRHAVEFTHDCKLQKNTLRQISINIASQIKYLSKDDRN